MPSGSRGGGHGGHNFGGFKSSSKPYARSHKNPMRYRSGINKYNRVYMRKSGIHKPKSYMGGGIFQLGYLIVVASILFIIMLLIFITQQSHINQIRADQDYYFKMIENADHDQYMIGTVSGMFIGDAGKYYISYNLENNGRKLWPEDGYTYMIYSKAEADAIVLSRTLEIVVEYLPLTSDTDSINADYMDYDLSDDGTYINATRLRMASIIIGTISLATLVGSIIYYYKTSISYKISDSEKSKYLKSTLENDHEKDVEYCINCGSVMDLYDGKCPSCGSTSSYKPNS